MKKANPKTDPALLLGAALLHLKALAECALLSEAQDAYADIDRGRLQRAVWRAKVIGKTRVADALGNALTLIEAVPHLKGDEQFLEYKDVLAPVLRSLEQKCTN